MKSHVICLLVFCSFFSISTLGQDCNSQNWADVEIRVMTQKNAPVGYTQSSEGAIISRLHGPIKQLEDFNLEELQEMKKMAKKNSSCLVFVDINKLYNFTHLKSNELYYFWVHKD